MYGCACRRRINRAAIDTFSVTVRSSSEQSRGRQDWFVAEQDLRSNSCPHILLPYSKSPGLVVCPLKGSVGLQVRPTKDHLIGTQSELKKFGDPSEGIPQAVASSTYIWISRLEATSIELWPSHTPCLSALSSLSPESLTS